MVFGVNIVISGKMGNFFRTFEVIIKKQQMLAAEQQLLETFLEKLFIPEHTENKESIYDADNSPVTVILEACPVGV